MVLRSSSNGKIKQLRRFGSSSTHLTLSESSKNSGHWTSDQTFIESSSSSSSTGIEVLAVEWADPEECRKEARFSSSNNKERKQHHQDPLLPWFRRRRLVRTILFVIIALAIFSIVGVIVRSSRRIVPRNSENEFASGNRTSESQLHLANDETMMEIPSLASPETINGHTPILDSAAEASSAPESKAEPKEAIVLNPNESLTAGQFRYSPNRRFKVGIPKNNGNLVLMEVDPLAGERELWSSSTNTSRPITFCFLQTDGNLVLRDIETRKALWMTKTHNNEHAKLVLNDSGRLAMQAANDLKTILWMEGIPRRAYNGPSSEDMRFPIRGAFYYPWYPATWEVDGHMAHYETSLGRYSSSNAEVAAAHVEAMDFGRIQLSIASWWGPSTNLDRARLTMLMDESSSSSSSIGQKSPLKWTVYHEDERDYDPTPEEIRKDLDYLKKWFAWHEAWAHIESKPVIFVYNEDGCDIASRWMNASQGEWYVVLKLFSGFEDCADQPDSWHQYGVGKTDGTVHNPGHSYVVSPGFWRADTSIPYLKRLNRTEFCDSTQKMVQSREKWQLIVSFNEAGEGTLIEPSPNWESNSGFGDYLDCLHEHHGETG